MAVSLLQLFYDYVSVLLVSGKVCDCSTPWTFLLPLFSYIASVVLYSVYGIYSFSLFYLHFVLPRCFGKAVLILAFSRYIYFKIFGPKLQQGRLKQFFFFQKVNQ